MALSKVIKIADGVTNQFAVSFELGYIRQQDINARVNEEVDGTGAPTYRTITFLSPEMLQISGAVPEAGDMVTFTRTVPRDELLVDYEDGDIINDDNLNTSQKQALMLIHELLDGRFETFDTDVDYGGFRIVNLGTPVDPTDAATKAYTDSRVDDAAGNAAIATAAAAAASTSASESNGWSAKSQEWAVSPSLVDGLDYSAKYWAGQSADFAESVNTATFLRRDGTTPMTGPLTVATIMPVASTIGFSVRPMFGLYTPWDSLNLQNPVNDAPSDGSIYARTNGTWSPIVVTGIADAPSDGTYYLRKDATWVNPVVLDDAGKIDYFARNTAPSGWLAANGSAVALATYPRLISIYCGDSQNATAEWGYRCTNPASPASTRSITGAYIALPSLGGEFIRGWDNGRGVDAGRSLWASQAFAMQSHNHSISDPGHVHGQFTHVAQTNYGGGPSDSASVNLQYAVNTLTGYTGISIVATGGSETRPRNVAMLACIRY